MTYRLVLCGVIVLSLASMHALAGEEVKLIEGLEYSNPDDQHLQLNLALPSSKEGRSAAVLCVHGGGFRAGKRERWNKLCRQLAERGYVAATATYRLAPKYQFPAAVHDVKAAVRWLRKNADKYRIDPNRIGVVGDSAGGHLAQFLGVTGGVSRFEGPQEDKHSSRVQCVVNYYGPSDLTKSYGKSVDAAEVLPLWLGGDATKERQRHILASPLNWVTPNSAPTLLLHGSKDPYVAIEQAEWIHERLQRAGVEVKFLRLEGAGHGFRGEQLKQAEAAMFAFLKRQLQK